MIWFGPVEGDNLAHRLDLTGLDPRETVAMATQITRALAALHARQIVHRDVKPSVLAVGFYTETQNPRFAFRGSGCSHRKMRAVAY